MTTISALPTDPPSRTSPATFSTRMDSTLGAIPTLISEINTVAGEVNSNAASAAVSAAAALQSRYTAQASANFIGAWSSQTGAATVPTAVYHDSKYWQLLSDLADITAKEPGTGVEWAEIVVNTSSTGGATAVTTGVDATLGTSRVQSITTTVANLAITLPAVSESDEGGPVWVIYNAGAYDFFLYNSNGSLIGKFAYNEGAMAFLTDYSTQEYIFTRIDVGDMSTIIPGAASVFESASVTDIAVCKLDTDKAIVCYKDAGNSNKGTACVLSVSGVSIAAGSPVVFEDASTMSISVCQLGTDKAIVTYNDIGNSEKGTACVLSVSGTTITAGTPVVFNNGVTYYTSVCQLDADNALVCFQDQGNSSYGTACVLAVSGTTITAGSEAVIESAVGAHISVAKINTNKAIVCYQKASASGTACVLSVSGTTITPGTSANFEGGSVTNCKIAKLDTDKIVVCYTDAGSAGSSCVLSVSGTTITAGTALDLGASISGISVQQIETNKAVVCYKDGGNSNYGTARILTASAAVLAAGSAVVFESATTNYSALCESSTNKFVATYSDAGNSNYGTSITISLGTV